LSAKICHPGWSCADLGRHRLRDLATAEHIYQVVAPDLPDAFPALKSVEVVANNLPRQLTTFIRARTRDQGGNGVPARSRLPGRDQLAHARAETVTALPGRRPLVGSCPSSRRP
jgi:hypothetical protein